MKFVMPLLVFLGLLALGLNPALADQPKPYELLLQEPATPVAERIAEFHNLLLYIITGIVIFVLALLLYVVIRFNARANPVPSKTTHNTLLEVIWTAVPVIILIVIAIPSFKLLYYQDRVEQPEMTLKITGYQWYWGYEYPEYDGKSFLSNMVAEGDIDKEAGQVRNLSTDNPVVLPVDTTILLQITAADVLHSFAVPAFGIKTDAVPGRLNEAWIRIERPGTYFGQCSELCGAKHGFMPIEIKAVPKEEFAAWIGVPKSGEPALSEANENGMISVSKDADTASDKKKSAEAETAAQPAVDAVTEEAAPAVDAPSEEAQPKE
ncbi:MAG: cytochrome c oxidase subunit II [Pseudobdellovibrionaceae bacterium]